MCSPHLLLLAMHMPLGEMVQVLSALHCCFKRAKALASSIATASCRPGSVHQTHARVQCRAVQVQPLLRLLHSTVQSVQYSTVQSV